jgi:hypothetical protein
MSCLAFCSFVVTRTMFRLPAAWSKCGHGDGLEGLSRRKTDRPGIPVPALHN